MTYHQLINGAIYIFTELGIADQVIHASPDRDFTIKEITVDDRQQWNSQLLYRILRACAYGGIVELINDDRHFILTQSGLMMTSDHPSYLRDHVRFFSGPVFTGACQQITNTVRGEGTGNGIARVSGGLDLYTLISQPDQKEFSSMFSDAMTTFSVQTGAKLAVEIDFSRFRTMVNVGGNRGRFLAEIFQNSSIIQHGIIFNLPHIINQLNIGELSKSREIHNDQWSFVYGDMFRPTTIPSADAYILTYILHNYNDNKCLEILSSIR